MKKQDTLSHKRLREVLDYDPLTGEFSWRDRLGSGGHNRQKDRDAGSVRADGYRYIFIDYVAYVAARLAFFWMMGRWPRGQMDHKNRDRSDDRWSNLREATPTQNQGNKINRNNALGLKGVCWEASRHKFKAYIEVAGRSVNLGRFDTAEEAQAAYAEAAQKYFGKFARTTE